MGRWAYGGELAVTVEPGPCHSCPWKRQTEKKKNLLYIWCKYNPFWGAKKSIIVKDESHISCSFCANSGVGIDQPQTIIHGMTITKLRHQSTGTIGVGFLRWFSGANRIKIEPFNRTLKLVKWPRIFGHRHCDLWTISKS